MKINIRQFSIITFYLIVSLKFLALPSLVYETAKNDSWLCFVIIALIDILIIWSVVYILKSNKEKNFYEFLKHRFGIVLTKIFCVAFFIIFLVDILDAVTGIQRLLVESFFSEINWLAFVLALLATTSFIVYKGLRNIGRVCENFVYMVVAGLIFIVVKSVQEIDFTFFLPFMTNGTMPIFRGVIDHITWFGAPIALLFMMGDIDFSEYRKRIVWRYVLLGAGAVFLMVVAFYGIFGATAGVHSFALSDLSQVSNTFTALDELSWFVVLLWLTAQIMQLTIFIYAGVMSLKYVFNINGTRIPIAIIDTLIILYVNVREFQINMEEMFYSTFIINFELSVKFGVLFLIFVVNVIYFNITKKKKTDKFKPHKKLSVKEKEYARKT